MFGELDPQAPLFIVFQRGAGLNRRQDKAVRVFDGKEHTVSVGTLQRYQAVDKNVPGLMVFVGVRNEFFIIIFVANMGQLFARRRAVLV